MDVRMFEYGRLRWAFQYPHPIETVLEWASNFRSRKSKYHLAWMPIRKRGDGSLWRTYRWLQPRMWQRSRFFFCCCVRSFPTPFTMKNKHRQCVTIQLHFQVWTLRFLIVTFQFIPELRVMWAVYTTWWQMMSMSVCWARDIFRIALLQLLLLPLLLRQLRPRRRL